MAVHIFRVCLAGMLLFPEAILYYITFRSTTIYLLKKKKENYRFISTECSTKHTPISRDRKKNTKAKYQYTQHTGNDAEAGREKTIPKFTERLFLWKWYFALLPSGPTREQLKSKATYTKPNSKPTGVQQHRHVFWLTLGPLTLFPGSAEGFAPAWAHW